MTETVTLALQGKFVQLGADPEAPVLFVLSPDKQSIAITKADRHQSCSVELDASEAADLRDILNALKEGEDKPLDPTRTPRPRCCRECDHLSVGEGECLNPAIKGLHRLHVFAFDVIPDWCPLPKAEEAAK